MSARCDLGDSVPRSSEECGSGYDVPAKERTLAEERLQRPRREMWRKLEQRLLLDLSYALARDPEQATRSPRASSAPRRRDPKYSRRIFDSRSFRLDSDSSIASVSAFSNVCSSGVGLMLSGR